MANRGALVYKRTAMDPVRRPAVPRLLAAIVFAVVLADCLLWSARIIPGDAPDEPDHVALRAFVAREGRLPRVGEAGFDLHFIDLTAKRRVETVADPVSGAVSWNFPPGHRFDLRQPYLFSPQLAHLLGGAFCRALGGFTLARARAFNALCVAAAALAVFVAAWTAWRRAGPAVVAGLGFGLWPQVAFVGGYVNDDAFALLAAALVVAALAAIDRDGMNGRRSAFLGLALGLVALSKYYVYAAFGLVLLWGLARARAAGRAFPRGMLVAAGVAALVSGWWFVRNALIYKGDPLALGVIGRRIDAIAAALPPRVAANTDLLSASSLHRRGQPVSALFVHGWIRLTADSFFGRFGWMSRRFPVAVYVAAAALLAGAVLGVLRRRTDAAVPRSLVFVLFGPVFLVLLLFESLSNSYFVDWQPQGRYLLPSLAGLWPFVVGLGTRHAPPVGRIYPWALLAFVAAANAAAVAFYVVPRG